MATRSTPQTERLYRSGPFELSEQEGELRKNGVRLKLQEQPFRVLVELVANAGRTVTREELQQKLWLADTFVDFDVGLNTAIRKLRQALGDDADQPRYIETVAKRGYRFIAPVTDAAPVLQLIAKDSPKLSPRRNWLPLAVTVCIFTALAFFVYWWRAPPAVPRVTAIAQLTDDGEAKCCRLATDGSRIYFNEGSPGSFKLAQVAAPGGQIGLIPTALGDPRVLALGPDGSELLVSSGSSNDNNSSFPLWSIPLPAGEPHHFAQIEAQDADYFPDGRMVFAHGADVYAAGKDGSNARKLFSASGHVAELRVAPDGSQIAFNIFGEDGVSVAVRKLDGSTTRSIPASCCARWTPDRKYLVFSKVDVARKDLWVLPAKAGLFRRSEQPIRLTNGPLSYGGSGVVISRDGRQIFTIGKSLRGELVRYDMHLKQFVPFLSGISASSPTFSRDGEWVAYLSYPDRTLWRSRIDGTERLQLTTSNVGDPVFISPNGKQVLFSGKGGTFEISMEGGSPPQKITGEDSEPVGWSPDGKFLLLSSRINGKAYLEKNSTYFQTLDVQSGKLSLIPGSNGIDISQLGGTWWPAQNLLVASAQDRLVTFDFNAQKWSDLLLGDFVSCAPSVDSKFIYCATGGAEPKALRIRITDRKVETITSLKDVRRSLFSGEITVAPDGSPIFTRDVGSQEIYALTVAWP